jgi:hypothetical protein
MREEPEEREGGGMDGWMDGGGRKDIHSLSHAHIHTLAYEESGGLLTGMRGDVRSMPAPAAHIHTQIS